MPAIALRSWMTSLLLIAAAILALATAPTAIAQTPPAQELELARPILVRSVGLSIQLPLGARYETTQMTGGQAAFTMHSPDNTWLLKLHNPISNDKKLSTAGVADSLIADLTKTREKVYQDKTRKTTVRIFDRNDALEINDKIASRFYATVPNGIGGVTFVSGYTIFEVAPGRFAILQIDSGEDMFERTRPQYEQVIATARFRNPEEMASERAAGIFAGDAVLASLGARDLEPLLAKKALWFRVYKPAANGNDKNAEEIAYQRIEHRFGHRGDLDPRKPQSKWRTTDHDPGVIVHQIARYLTGEGIVDSEAIYFLAAESDEEAWTVRMISQQGQAKQTWTESGVRQSDSIKVTIDQPGAPPIIKSWKTPPQAYVSLVTARLLPRILAQHGAAAVFNFYQYNTNDSEIALRRDLLEPIEKSDTNAPKNAVWLLTTRTNENAADSKVYLDNAGALLQRIDSSGVITEPVDLQHLKRLWRAKKLPMS